MGINPGKRSWNEISNFSLLLTIFFILIPFLLLAQSSEPGWIDAGSIRFQENISGKCMMAETSEKIISPQTFPGLFHHYDSSQPLSPKVPLHFMENTMALRFKLSNTTAEKKDLYFTPGYYVRDILVYKGGSDSGTSNLQLLPDSLIKSVIYPSAKLLELAPGEKAVYYVSFHFIRTNVNNLSPCLIERDYLPAWLKNLKYRDPLVDITTYIISGILLLMIFYSLAVYLQSYNREFLYYSIYTFCSTFLFFFKSYSLTESKEWNFFYEEYLDFIILGLGVYFYLIFMRRFIDTREKHPSLDKFLRIANWILVGLLLIFSIVYFFSDKYVLLFSLENYVTKIYMFSIGIVFIVYSLKKKDKLLNYLAAGNFALLFFSVLSLLRLIGVKFAEDNSSILNKGLLYYEVGVVLELIFFLSGSCL